MITPQTENIQLAQALGLSVSLYLKREDQHPLGSHKGRSIPLMIDKYAAAGIKNFVISSSGNAALAAAKYIADKPELTLTVFVGKNIDREKLSTITNIVKQSHKNQGIASSPPEADPRNDIVIQQVSNPKQSAFQLDKQGLTKNLRQSTDDNALMGYYDLAKELSEIKNLSAVFIPTSSGTTAQGLYEGFQKIGINPQIHIVQTEACNPFCHPRENGDPVVECLDSRLRGNDNSSLATAIVDKVAHRKNKISEILKNSRGQGWIINNEEITTSIKLVTQTTGQIISPNSALAIAGLAQALRSGKKFSGSVAVIFTGR